MEGCEGCCDAANCLADVVVACGVAQANVAGSAECGTIHSGHMGFLKEIHSHVGGVGDGALAIGLAEVARHLGEDVEGALGMVDAQPGNLAKEAHHKVAAALKSLPHGLDALL